MYSRRFTGNGDLPPGYGGSAYRAPEGAGSSRQEEDPPAWEKGNEGSSAPSGGRGDPYEERREAGYGEPPLRPSRRPLYEACRNCPARPSEDAPAPQDAPSRRRQPPRALPGTEGGIFSLAGKSFSVEDLLLAGMILLLTAEGKKEGAIDGELMLILCLLFLAG